MGFYLENYNVGMVIDLETLDDNIETIARDVIELMQRDTAVEDNFSRLFEKHFDKAMAVEKYGTLYEQLQSVPS